MDRERISEGEDEGVGDVGEEEIGAGNGELTEIGGGAVSEVSEG